MSKRPKDQVYAATPVSSLVKRKKTIKNLIGFLIFTVISTAAYLLDIYGVGIFMLNERHSLMRAIFLFSICICAYYLFMLLSILQIHIRNGSETEIGMMSSFNRVLAGFAVLISLIYLFGRLSSFATFFTMFGGLLLGWSLQAPVSGFAAWIMVTLMRPYRIKDRVQFPSLGLIGDVVRFTPMYLTLNQVGGSIGSEEPVGRMVHVPNAMLFTQVVINYTHLKTTETASYILDEALFRITLDSDWDTVETILLSTAEMVTKDIMEKTGIRPYVRADTWEYGTLFRLRYMTDATDRPRIMYEIVKHATKQIQRNLNVDLAIPYVYSFKRGVGSSSKNQQKSEENIENIDISLIHGGSLESVKKLPDDDPEVCEIARKINEVGLLQPIVVTRSLDDSGYDILLGEKRLKACLLLKWKKIPAIIRNPIGTDISRKQDDLKRDDT